MTIAMRLAIGNALVDRQAGGAPAPPPETIVRTAKGTAYAEGQGSSSDITIAGVSVAAGTWLLVAVANDNFSLSPLSGVNLGATPLAYIANQDFTGDRDVSLWGAYFASATTGDLVAFTTDGLNSSLAMLALQVAGLASSAAVDQTKVAAGGGTSPSSGATGTPVQDHEFVIGVVGTDGPRTDSAGTWGNSFTEGQREGTNQSPTVDVTVSEGFLIQTAAAARTAAKTGITWRHWGAICATFKAA